MSLRRKTNKNKKVLFVGRPLAAFFLLIKDISFCKISVKKFRMKILEIIIDTINRYSKLRDFSLSFVLS